MLELLSGWKARVAAALLLAWLLQMSDGSAFWAGALPSALSCGAVLVLAWHVLTARRDHTTDRP
jgi:hypothetical protein